MRAGLALAATTLVASPGGQGGRSGPDWSGRNPARPDHGAGACLRGQSSERFSDVPGLEASNPGGERLARFLSL